MQDQGRPRVERKLGRLLGSPLFGLFVTVFSLSATIVTLSAAVVILRDYMEQRVLRQIVVSDPTSTLAKIEEVKRTLAQIEQLAVEVEELGYIAIEAQQKADEATALLNLSEEELTALERRLNPAQGIWLNIGIGVVMLFVGYFLEKALNALLKIPNSKQ